MCINNNVSIDIILLLLVVSIYWYKIKKQVIGIF